MNNSTVRTTLSLPAELFKAADNAVKQGKAKSRNEFVAMAEAKFRKLVFQVCSS